MSHGKSERVQLRWHLGPIVNSDRAHSARILVEHLSLDFSYDSVSFFF